MKSIRSTWGVTLNVPTMSLGFSDSETLILLTLWQLKALGTRGVTMDDLASRLSSGQKGETLDILKRLEARSLVTITSRAGNEQFALSLLGAAFVRQLQDKQLGDATREF